MLQPEEQFHYSTCFATGWGKDQFGAEGQYQVRTNVRLCSLFLKTHKLTLCLKTPFTNWHWQVVLKEIDLPVVEHGQCEDALRTTRQEEKSSEIVCWHLVEDFW